MQTDGCGCEGGFAYSEKDGQMMKRAGRARVLNIYVRGLGLEERSEQVPWMTTRTRKKKEF